jgi:predicted ABC-type sugar transport system permease subunit
MAQAGSHRCCIHCRGSRNEYPRQASGGVVSGLVIRALKNRMSMLGVGSECDQLIKDSVHLAAVAIDAYNSRRSGAR